jgi:hypothetical protein
MGVFADVAGHSEFDIRTLWSCDNGSHGFLLGGGSSNLFTNLHINRLFTCRNRHSGTVLYGNVKNFSFDHIVTVDNNQADSGHHNLIFNRFSITGGTISHLWSEGGGGVVGPGIEGDVHIVRDHVQDSIVLSDFTTVNGMGAEAAGAGNAPTASEYRVGDTVENTDDNTLWQKVSSGSMIALG